MIEKIKKAIKEGKRSVEINKDSTAVKVMESLGYSVEPIYGDSSYFAVVAIVLVCGGDRVLVEDH